MGTSLALRNIESAFGLNIYFPTRKSCGKAYVLTFVADGKGKLRIGNGYMTGFFPVLVNFDGENVRRSKSRRLKLCGILVIDYNINFFSAQRFNDCSHTRALGADTGADGIHVFVLGNNCDFRS